MSLMPCLICGIPTKGSRCPQCDAIYKANNPRIRATPTERGYDARWKRIRIQVLNRDQWSCHYCGKKISGSDATVDHQIAISNGGAMHDPLNLVAACRSCNSRKKDK